MWALEVQAMTEKPKLLSATTNEDGDVVSIHADLSGLKKLQDSISYMITKLEKDTCDHDHLRSEDWAGYELTTTMLDSEQSKGNKQVHHIKLYAWTDEWKNKHEL